MLKSRIHRATVTEADLHYEGSITIDEDLMEAADLLEYEKVAIFDITNGNRLETYVIRGERGSGVIGINGAAAHLVHVGDLIIIVGYAAVEPDGSVMVKVPANVPLAVEVLDAEGRRIGPPHANWFQVQPGDTLNCTGCHDPINAGLEAHGRDNKDTGIEQSPLEALIRQQLRVVVQPCKYLRLTCCNIPVEEGKNKGKDEGKDPNQKEVKNSRKQHVVLSVPT